MKLETTYYPESCKDIYSVDLRPQALRKERNNTRLRLVKVVGIASIVAASLLILPKFLWCKPLGYFKDGKVDSSARSSSGKTILPEPFDWSKVTPSKSLDWHRCYDEFYCARFKVPLDYLDPALGEAAIALIKSPASVTPDSKDYRGPVLFNPGGPSGSGVGLLIGAAELFRKIIGDEYDLIGFDPRGVGLTTPLFAPFSTQTDAGAFFTQLQMNMNATTDSLGLALAQNKILGWLAENRAKLVAQHLSTPTVARDMMTIVRAYGRDKLQYWGFSYGTVLGATFAAMFPDNVERLILDGVVDAEDYYKGLWFNNLHDTDAVLEMLYQACFEAGSEICPLYENSTTLIGERVNRILNGLKTSPQSFYNPVQDGHDGSMMQYDVVDYTMAKWALFSTLYNIHAGGAYIFNAFADLERGDPRAIWAISVKRVAETRLPCECGPKSPPIPSFGLFDTVETTIAIACSDAAEVSDDIDELRRFYDELANLSQFADGWWIHIGCAGWKVPAVERFNGSFSQNTSFPVLLIGNTADPVSPLRSAHKLSKDLSGSAVLIQDSPGHCSIAAVSLCTAKTIRAYFREGKLPEHGKICSVESSVFPSTSGIDLEDLDEADRELLGASQSLHEKYFVPILPSSRRLARNH